PFVADTPLDILILVRTQEPAPPSRYRPKLARDLDTICLKCLAKDPAQRYATAAALADDLEHFLAGEPIQARPAGWWERGAKWARRRPAVAALTALSLLVTVLGLGGIVWQWREARAALVQRDQTLYFKNVSLAERYVAGGQPYRAEQVLDDCPAELRHWEWHYLKRQCHPIVLRLRGHTDLVIGLASSSDNRWLASASRDGTVKLWDVATGAELR